jgi:acetylornithine deacetylase/succinyl-diaminopimelate desuccinylase-like protein
MKPFDNDAALRLLREFLRFDTSNPPGDEEEAALFLEDTLKREGIETRLYSPLPKRANLYARVRGKKKGKPLILLGHIDVVPAREDGWTLPPFGGEVHDGYVYGRGAIDMKAQVICQVAALINLSRRGQVPERDIILLATCDEETGGEYGVKYMLDVMPELADAGFVVSEGGCLVEEEGFIHAQVSVSEKRLSQFMIRARGTGGHGSMPHRDSANEKIVGACNRILSHQWPLRPTRVVSTYLNGVLRGKRPGGIQFTTLREGLTKKGFREYCENNLVYNALLRNTVTLTILKGGEKVNVIPPESQAYFDARLLPVENQQRFFARIRSLCGPDIEIVPIGKVKADPPPSGYTSPYFRRIREAVRKIYGPVPVLPFVTTGATDLRYFRQLGILSYGFFPVLLTNQELYRMHSVNERLSLENLNKALAGTEEIVRFLASSL